MINVCTENDLYHEPRDVIIMSQFAVSELVDNDNDNVLPLVNLLKKSIPLVVVKMTFTNILSKTQRDLKVIIYL